MNRSALVPDEIDAVVFDVIGTLVDEERTWAAAAQQLAKAAGIEDAVDLRRRWSQILERRMDAVVAGDAPWRPHQQLVSDSAQEAIMTAGGDPAAAVVIAAIDGEYPAWSDVAPATASLRRNRLVAAISNGDLKALARLANANGINWDVALSAGSAGTFKPAPAAYRYAIEMLDLNPPRTLFVAAHPWDLRAAAVHGFRTAYVGRPSAEAPAENDRFDLSLTDLLELAELLRD
jgi:2-haloacid dehalogenase